MIKRKLLILSLFLLSISLFSCSSSSENVTDDKDNDIEIKEDEEKEVIDYTNAIFASPLGNGTGSMDDPCSLLDGINRLNDTNNALYLYGGTYNFTSSISLGKNGNPESFYKISAFEDEKVTLDFGMDYRKNPPKNGNYNSGIAKGIMIKGTYYHLYGLKVTNCGAHGIHIFGSHNKVENCILAYNGNTGLNISSPSTNPKETWAHDNLVLNCTSYGNYDWDRLDGEEGEDADGFGCKITSGINNVFDGCISYNNSDDGWDLFTKHQTGKIGSVTIRNCVAFNNGYSIDGKELKNGNGFKLGGRVLEVDHFVTNSIAFNNKANGFDDNSNPGTITLKDCTAYNNGAKNYAMGRFTDEINTYNSTWDENGTTYGPIENVPKSHNVFENCASYLGGSTDTFVGYATNCYFYRNNSFHSFTSKQVCNSKYNLGTIYNAHDIFKSRTIDLSDFENIHYIFRNKDKSVNLKGFLDLEDSYSFGAKLS